MPAVLWVDSRVGSREALPYLTKLGIDARLAQLDSADFTFEGNGPDNNIISVGIERKALGDLVTSLKDGRLQGMDAESGGGQLGRLQRSYDIAWLLVEGFWSVDAAGRVCWKRHSAALKPVPGGMREDGLVKQLLTLELRGGLHLVRTRDLAETARWVASTVRWFTDKKWNDHRTLFATYERQSLTPLSRFREIVQKFPAVGFEWSRAFEGQFEGNLDRFLHASAMEFSNITTGKPPKRFGDSKAGELADVCRALRGGI